MNDADIIKALECVSGKEIFCRECKYSAHLHYRECQRSAGKDALDLINRQKAEKEALINGQETLQKYIAEQKAEIERLQKAGEEAVSCFNRMESLYNIKCMELKVAKNQAITEFAERLKVELVVSQFECDGFLYDVYDVEETCDKIDQIAKEMKGEQ